MRLHTEAFTQRSSYTQNLLRTSLRKTTSQHYFLVLITKLAQSTSQYYFVLKAMDRVLPSTALYYKARKKDFPALLCTSKLARSISQYYFELQSLHKELPSTTSYYKARTEYFRTTLYILQTSTRHFPVLLRTTKLAHTTSQPSQYYFVLQCSQKVLPSTPSTTLYYKTCTRYHFVLQILHQYIFVRQGLHEVLSSTTLYYKACTHTHRFPVILCTTKRAKGTSL